MTSDFFLNGSSNRLKPSPVYHSADDTCIITTYYNPNKYRSKKKNFDRFIKPIIVSGLNYVVVECSFKENGYELDNSLNLVRVNSEAIVWQKERMLNIALENVPGNCSKIIWVDCDMLFSNPDWIQETSKLLNEFAIVQPFATAIRLPKNIFSYGGDGLKYQSFGAVYCESPQMLTKGDYVLHGHTGFAWAGRKEVFDNLGFYDCCLSGGGDHLMAHAFCGDWHSPCLKKMFLDNELFYKHYVSWAKEIFKRVKGSVGFSCGTALHLWHGEYKNRKYLENMQFLSKVNFNPEADIFINESGCWEIMKENTVVANWSENYFGKRKEDGGR